MLGKMWLHKSSKKIAGIYIEKEFRRKYIDFRRRYPQAAENLDESVH